MPQHSPHADRPLVASSILTLLFEVFLVVGIQDKALLVVTPWQDDPFHTWVSLALFALPMLLTVTAVRMAGPWLPWGRSGAAGRRRDLVRAGLVMTAFDATTALVCWLAVLLRADHALWTGRTTWLVGALALLTVPVPIVAWTGLRCLRRLPVERDADWVGDVLPAALATWVRRNDRLVFLAASVVAAVGIIGALAYGERWTDPLLIGWGLGVEVACYYAFCVLTNAALGFVDRPMRDRRTERAFVVGSLAGLTAVAWHDQLAAWLGLAPLDVGHLVEVTGGAGLLGFVVALAALRIRPGRWSRPARPAR
jgi:predicted outer membrane lipoprotein